MNALNLLSARLIGPTPASVQSSIPAEARRDLAKGRSWFWIQLRRGRSTEARKDKDGAPSRPALQPDQEDKETAITDTGYNAQSPQSNGSSAYDEKSPTAKGSGPDPSGEGRNETEDTSGWVTIPRRLAHALIASIRWILSTLATPGVYLIACMSDEDGRFSPLLPARRIYRVAVRPWRSRATAQAVGLSAAAAAAAAAPTTSRSDQLEMERRPQRPSQLYRHKSYAARHATSSDLGSDSVPMRYSNQPQGDGDVDDKASSRPSPRSRRVPFDMALPADRDFLIKVEEDRARRRRRMQMTDPPRSVDTALWPEALPLMPATLKSPTSPVSSLGMTRYPRAPAPPRPLIPRRRSSTYLPKGLPVEIPSKTLILDLDETLIHSLAKGGRMSTGHMVEVKLCTAMLGGGGGAPQHPILYYVHKRPHCDEFLRKVCRWYKLVVFTASVQEYADPVIDWLEQDRKYFMGRYYRQHCTFRGGNYIKDLSSVEPDLSQVMIVDNSPASYLFHPDNAIPIEGWISDPTDNHLLHLIPMLESLQYLTDVRAVLGLRMGEPGALSSTTA
ncbi:MAG: Nuclear envelope morphology protein 1 [Lichina confinis]|nr:MAG: Nuclear envelope morphology protein 1 [Lichina confinis]